MSDQVSNFINRYKTKVEKLQPHNIISEVGNKNNTTDKKLFKKLSKNCSPTNPMYIQYIIDLVGDKYGLNKFQKDFCLQIMDIDHYVNYHIQYYNINELTRRTYYPIINVFVDIVIMKLLTDNYAIEIFVRLKPNTNIMNKVLQDYIYVGQDHGERDYGNEISQLYLPTIGYTADDNKTRIVATFIRDMVNDFDFRISSSRIWTEESYFKLEISCIINCRLKIFYNNIVYYLERCKLTIGEKYRLSQKIHDELQTEFELVLQQGESGPHIYTPSHYISTKYP